MKLKDFLNSINYDKKALLDSDEKAERLYSPYVVNKAMSFFSDTIFHSNELNCKWWMDKKMQYDFYRLSVRKKKRYAAWLKKETEENIAIIKQVYGYTEDKANQVLNILGPKDLDVLKQSLQTGGIDNKG
jgi:hypothetical protein